MSFDIILNLLTLLRKLAIREDALNFPLLISLTASCTGFESGIIKSGCLLSLIISCSFSKPVANASASISHGFHLRQRGSSLAECSLTIFFYCHLSHTVHVRCLEWDLFHLFWPRLLPRLTDLLVTEDKA